MLSPYEIDKETRRIHFDISTSGADLNVSLERDSNDQPNLYVAQLPIESYNGITAVAFVPDVVKSFPCGLYWLSIKSGCNECGRCPVEIKSCVVSNFRQEKEMYCGDIQRDCVPCKPKCEPTDECNPQEVVIRRVIDADLS